MNTEKYTIQQLSGLLAEAIPTRPMYTDRTGKYKDEVSKSNINFSKTHLNYNLCSHDPYSTKQMKEMYTRITGRTVRKDAKWGGTILTLPKELKSEPDEVKRAFFEESYRILRDEIYKIKEEDVILGAVHMDETSPHMHFYYIPHHYGENGKDTVSWEKCMTRGVYMSQHSKLQKALNALKITDKEIKILNGETQGINVKAINQAQRKEYAELTQKIDEQKKEIESLKQEEITRTILLEDLKKENQQVNTELTSTQKALSDAQIRLKSAQNDKNQLEVTQKELKSEISQLTRDRETIIQQIVNTAMQAISRWYNGFKAKMDKLDTRPQKKTFMLKSKAKIQPKIEKLEAMIPEKNPNIITLSNEINKDLDEVDEEWER